MGKPLTDIYIKTGVNYWFGLISNGIGVVLSAFLMPFVVHRLGADGWAIYSFFLLFVAILTFFETALQTYSLQMSSEACVVGKAYVWWRDSIAWLFVGILLILLLSFQAIRILDFLNVSSTYQSWDSLLIFALINAIFRSISGLAKGGLQGQVGQISFYLFSNILNVLRPLWLIFVLVYLDKKVEFVLIAYLMYSFIEMFVYLRLDIKNNVTNLTLSNPRMSSSLLVPLILSSALSVFAMYMDKIVIFYQSSVLEASVYSFASSMAALLFLFVNLMISSFSSRFKELFMKEREEELRSIIFILTLGNNVIVGFVFLVFTAVSSYALPLLSLEISSADVTRYLIYMGISNYFMSSVWILGSVAVSMGRASFNVKTNISYIFLFFTIFFTLYALVEQWDFLLSLTVSSFLSMIFAVSLFKKSVLWFNTRLYFLLCHLLPLALSMLIFFGSFILLKMGLSIFVVGILFSILLAIYLVLSKIIVVLRSFKAKF